MNRVFGKDPAPVAVKGNEADEARDRPLAGALGYAIFWVDAERRKTPAEARAAEWKASTDGYAALGRTALTALTKQGVVLEKRSSTPVTGVTPDHVVIGAIAYAYFWTECQRGKLTAEASAQRWQASSKDYVPFGRTAHQVLLQQGVVAEMKAGA
jgi:hypothetical protein